ncbi:hypothetical protein C0989_012401 [Termitomyces sp. Mn162]|nr:hypothetical protein C0989_012401 [Termitomyces sp. Mn162]
MAALFNHENHKKNDHALLFNGEAQVLSSDKFFQKVEEQAKCKEPEAVQKAKNAELREVREDVLAIVEEEWLRIKVNHGANVKVWEAKCIKLASQEVPKKNWSKKPVQAWKPKVPIIVHESLEDVQDDDDEE